MAQGVSKILTKGIKHRSFLPPPEGLASERDDSTCAGRDKPANPLDVRAGSVCGSTRRPAFTSGQGSKDYCALVNVPKQGSEDVL